MIKDGIDKKEKIQSILMIGQSNMAGRGDVKDVAPIVNPKCFMLRMGRWQPMSEPINPDRSVHSENNCSGVSLAASFADELSRCTGAEIGLIPCADGGTRIEQWQPGEVLYDHAVYMTRLAMRTSDLAGIIWHQGESNCKNFTDEEYSKLFLNMVTSLRKDLNAENVPFIMGEISDRIAADKWNFADRVPEMNKLLHKLQKQVPLSGIASVENLTVMNDGIHFDSKSLRILGKRYFEEYKKLL